jgi:glutamate racemase
VEFVERGQTVGDEATVLAERLLAPIREAEVDAPLLGCTHTCSSPARSVT